MAYELRAVIGTTEVLGAVCETVKLDMVSLTLDLSLIAWTDEDFDRLRPSPEVDHSSSARYCHPRLVDEMTRASNIGPLAYVEADYFGGHEEQTAIIFDSGQVQWTSPPGDAKSAAWPNSPISQALRMLGVVAHPEKDEFDTVGLGRHRHTEAWLSE